MISLSPVLRNMRPLRQDIPSIGERFARNSRRDLHSVRLHQKAYVGITLVSLWNPCCAVFNKPHNKQKRRRGSPRPCWLQLIAQPRSNHAPCPQCGQPIIMAAMACARGAANTDPAHGCIAQNVAPGAAKVASQRDVGTHT